LEHTNLPIGFVVSLIVLTTSISPSHKMSPERALVPRNSVKRSPTILLLASTSAFALFSVAAGAGLFSDFDRWALDTSQQISSRVLDAVGNFFSLASSLEIIGAALISLLFLTLTGRRMLAGRLLAAFVVTGAVELAMKFFLPVPPVPDAAARIADPTPLVAFEYPFPYPSGHTLRSVLIFGTVFILWNNWIPRTVLTITVTGMALSRIYLGVHWISDVIGARSSVSPG